MGRKRGYTEVIYEGREIIRRGRQREMATTKKMEG